MTEVLTKKCTECGIVLEANENNFFKSSKGKYGFEAKCKTCRGKQIRIWQKENEDKERERSKKWRRDHPEYVKEYDKFWVESGGRKRSQKKRRSDPEKHAKDLEAQRRWVKENPEKFKQCQENYKLNNPEKRAEQYKKHRLRKKYGISLEDYVNSCGNQNGKCYICGEPADILTVDHDHKCCPGSGSCGKCVRGLLCGLCNFMLGAAKDNPESLKRGIEYLQNPPGLLTQPDPKYFEDSLSGDLTSVVQSETEETK